jgi:predicted nuclease of restriction endonuclease-like (RecB) superfamily
VPAWYPELRDSVSAQAQGHWRAVRAANTELLLTYWSIGREILERQQQEGCGAKVIDRLSADLKARFSHARGYSPRNLKYMRSLARQATRDQYLFDCLSSTQTRRERDLEKGLIDPVSRFFLTSRRLALLLCKSKENVVAEYALRSMSVPIGVAEWTKVVRTPLPADLASSLPSIEELEFELAAARDDAPPTETT